MVESARDEVIRMNQVKAQKKLVKERMAREKAISLWVAENLKKPFPKWLQPRFEKASYRMVRYIEEFTKLKTTKSILRILFYHLFIDWCLRIYGVQLRFSTEESGAVINVATFKKGKYFDSFIRPEEVNGYKNNT